MPTRVLIVEDEEPVRELLAEYLRGRSLVVVERATAGDGLRALAESAFNLLVTDLKLPDGDGLDLVRAAARQPHPPVTVAMSGYATVDDAILVLTSGATDLILKPFRLRDAHATLQRALVRGAEERHRRLAALALAWVEAAANAQSAAEVDLVATALPSLVAAWSPGTTVEVRDGVALPGWVAYGTSRVARVVPPDGRVVGWVGILHLALLRVGA